MFVLFLKNTIPNYKSHYYSLKKRQVKLKKKTMTRDPINYVNNNE